MRRNKRKGLSFFVKSFALDFFYPLMGVEPETSLEHFTGKQQN